jgi:hypothetical protein
MTTLFDAIVRRGHEQVYATMQTPDHGEVEMCFVYTRGVETVTKPNYWGTFFTVPGNPPKIELYINDKGGKGWGAPACQISQMTTRCTLLRFIQSNYTLYKGALYTYENVPRVTPEIQTLLAEPDAGRP